MGSAKCVDRVGLTGSRPRTAPAKRLSAWTMTREAITVGFDAGDGFLDRTRGSDIIRFRCAGRRFVSISHPDYVDHVLHEARVTGESRLYRREMWATSDELVAYT